MKILLWVAISLSLAFFSGCKQPDDDKNQASGDKQVEEKSLSTGTVEGLTQQIKQDSSNANLFYQRARLYYEGMDLNKALSDIGKAIHLEPGEADYRLLLADIYKAMNKFQDARTVLKKVANRSQRNVKANLKLAELELAYKDYQQALLHLNRVLDVEPDNARAFYVKGIVYMEKGDTNKAIDHYMQSVDNDPAFQDPYLQLGNIFAERGDPRAADFYNGALNIRPDDVETMHMLGTYYQNQEKLDKAMSTYHNILKVDSAHASTYYNMGFVEMVFRQNFDKAIEYYDKAIKYKSGYYQAFYNRGYAHELKEEYQQARDDYRKALKIRPNYAKAVQGMNRLDNVMY